jgi:hypothetical protein
VNWENLAKRSEKKDNWYGGDAVLYFFSLNI